VFDGDDSANKLASYTAYEYDAYPAPLRAYAPNTLGTYDLYDYGENRHPGPGILSHSGYYNPMPSNNVNGGGLGDQYITTRGNVTGVTTYLDLSNPSSPAKPVRETRDYDMAGNLIATSTACCEQTSFDYREVTQYAFPSSRTRGSKDNALLQVTTGASYDLNTGLTLEATDANGRTTETKYDAASWRPKEIILTTGARTTFAYDDKALKISRSSHLTPGGPAINRKEQFLDGLGQVLREDAVVDETVRETVETTFDVMGRLWKQTRPYRTGETPQWKETLYDELGRVVSGLEPGYDPATNASAVTFSYNEVTRPAGASAEAGQTTATTDSWGRWKWARQDALGRLAEVVEPNPGGGSGLVTKYSYDVLGNLTRVDQGVQVRSFRYDPLGRLTHQKLAESRATLDDSGTYVGPTAAEARWGDVFAYDTRSNMISRTDARGVRTNYNYNDDPLNRLQEIKYETSMVNTAEVTVLPAPTVKYAYRTKTVATQALDVTQLEGVTLKYEGAQQEVSVESFGFDAEGRVARKTLAMPGKPELRIDYGYDTLGRVKELTYPAQYAAGVQSPVRKIVKQTFDTVGRMSALRVNNLGGAAADSDYASQTSYSAAGQLRSVAVGSGANQVTETYDYDAPSGLLKSLRVTRGTTLLNGYDYGYAQGRPCFGDACPSVLRQMAYTGQITEARDAVTGVYTFYAYDSLGRLKQAERGQSVTKPARQFVSHWVQDYSYDIYGNRTAVAASAPAAAPPDGHASLAYDPATNRVTTPGFGYDHAGNQTQNGTGQTLLYDAAGRLAKIQEQSGTTVVTVATYTYNEANRRITTQRGAENSAQKTYYVWEGGSVIAEYAESATQPSPQWAKNYIHVGGRLLATQKPDGAGGEAVQYHHPDHLSTRVITSPADAGGTVTAAQEALPFGTSLSTTGAQDATDRRFTSYPRSATTGLDYAVNRHYDPRQGRFTQVDPSGARAVDPADPQTWNMYAYCGNDPVNRTDPEGLFFGLGSILRWAGRFLSGLFGGPGGIRSSASLSYGNLPLVSVSLSNNYQDLNFQFLGGVVSFQARTGNQNQESREDRLLRIALEDVRTILGTFNSCSSFFISPGLALEALSRINFTPGTVTGEGSFRKGIHMEVPSGLPPRGAAYRVPTTATVNRNGPFYRRSVFVDGRLAQTPSFGGYGADTRRSRALQIFHELAHTLLKASIPRNDRTGADPRWLIPNDGDAPDQSTTNNSTILKHCRTQIDALDQ
jgi:RHS repeat-associated protein